MSLSHAVVRLLIMLLKFLFDPPLFGLDGPKCSSSRHAALSFGFPMILLRICVSNVPVDALAARGMRLMSVTHRGCDSLG